MMIFKKFYYTIGFFFCVDSQYCKINIGYKFSSGHLFYFMRFLFFFLYLNSVHISLDRVFSLYII